MARPSCHQAAHLAWALGGTSPPVAAAGQQFARLRLRPYKFDSEVLSHARVRLWAVLQRGSWVASGSELLLHARARAPVPRTSQSTSA
eukprot:364283-Chlamydomonas_euryale.AAC.30